MTVTSLGGVTAISNDIDHLLVTPIDVNSISNLTNRNDVIRSDKQMVSH